MKEEDLAEKQEPEQEKVVSVLGSWLGLWGFFFFGIPNERTVKLTAQSKDSSVITMERPHSFRILLLLTIFFNFFLHG